MKEKYSSFPSMYLPLTCEPKGPSHESRSEPHGNAAESPVPSQYFPVSIHYRM